MQEKLFFIHWKSDEAKVRAYGLQSTAWKVQYEAEDESAAIRKIKSFKPTVILIDLSLEPQLGRALALKLRKRKDTKNTPFIFMDGGGEEVSKARRQFPDASFISRRGLMRSLAKFQPEQSSGDKKAKSSAKSKAPPKAKVISKKAAAPKKKTSRKKSRAS